MYKSDSKNDIGTHPDKLSQAREEINAVDREMAELFCRRMDAVKKVYEYKSEHGLPVLDKGREAQVIERNSGYVSDGTVRRYYVKFLNDVMSVSRSYQSELMHGMKVAYSGVEGAFADIAAGRIFPDAQRVPKATFTEAYTSVILGECECAVLPLENSFAGEVGQVTDLMFSGPLYVNGIYDLPVTQSLLGVKGALISGIREVVSHPQALSQCAPYIEAHGFRKTEYANTAMAAKFVYEKNDPSVAAIANAETAELYGLEVLANAINESNLNTTRFAVFTRALSDSDMKSGNHFILTFTVRNEAGSLARAIGIIGKHGFNMRSLRSRPMKELLWQYYFYMEAEGDIYSDNGRAMMEELSSCCDKLKIVGCYKSSQA